MDASTHGLTPRRDSGFTLVEMLTSLLLMGIVITSMWMVFGSVNSVANNLASTSSSAEEARRTLGILTDEIRQAVEPTEGLGAFASAGTWGCTFYCDANHDDVPEKIGYSVTNGAVYRTTQSSLTSAAPYDFTGAARSSIYISDLANDATAPLFSYFGADGNATTTLSAISLVRVTVVARSGAGGVKLGTSMTSEVKIRSINSDVLD